MRKRGGSVHPVSSCPESVWGWQKQTRRWQRGLETESSGASFPTLSLLAPLSFWGVGLLDWVFLQLVFHQVLSDHCNSEGKVCLSLLLILLLTHKDQRICSVISLYLHFLESASALHPLPSQPLVETDSVTGLVVWSSPMEPALDARVPDFVQLFAMGIVHHFWSLTFFTWNVRAWTRSSLRLLPVLTFHCKHLEYIYY